MSDPDQLTSADRHALGRMERELVHVHARCRTTDGREVFALEHVHPAMWADQPMMRAFLVSVLAPAAAGGDPPATLDLDTFSMHQKHPTIFSDGLA